MLNLEVGTCASNDDSAVTKRRRRGEQDQSCSNFILYGVACLCRLQNHYLFYPTHAQLHLHPSMLPTPFSSLHQSDELIIWGFFSRMTNLRRNLYFSVILSSLRDKIWMMQVRDELRMTVIAYQTLYESSIAFGIRKALRAEQGDASLTQRVKGDGSRDF